MGDGLYDLAVVGAGPAGSTIAILAARHGLRVALIDRRSFPRDKTCGDGIGPTAVRALREIGIGDVFDGCTPVRDVTIYGPGGEQLAGPIPAIDGEPAYGYVIPRIEFDQRLFGRALAEGAEDFQGHRFTGMRLLPDRREIDLRAADGAERTLQARLVVGADGAYSAVRKILDPPVPETAKDHTLLAMRAYAGSPDFLPGAKLGPRLLFEFTRDLLPSYGWIFPADDGSASTSIRPSGTTM
jgi:flavin-dependent dehydrogenase